MSAPQKLVDPGSVETLVRKRAALGYDPRSMDLVRTGLNALNDAIQLRRDRDFLPHIIADLQVFLFKEIEQCWPDGLPRAYKAWLTSARRQAEKYYKGLAKTVPTG